MPDKVRALVVALADMRLIEAKTSMPERYARLEVEDPEPEDAKSRLVRVESADGTVLAEVILGKRRHRLTGTSRPAPICAARARRRAGLRAAASTSTTRSSTGSTRRSSTSTRRASGGSRSGPPAGRGTSRGATSAGAPLQLADLAEGEQVERRCRSQPPRRRARQAQPRGGQAARRARLARDRAHRDRDQLRWRRADVRLAKVDDEPWAMLDARAVEPLAAPPAEPASEARPVRPMPASRSRRSRSRTRMARRRSL